MTSDETEINHLRETMDDENEWGEPVKPTSRRRLDAVVSVRFDPNELELIRKAAPEGNVSDFIRKATLGAASNLEPVWYIEGSYLTSTTTEPEVVMSASVSSTSYSSGFITNDLPAATPRLRSAS
jgi:hypothetical protein